MSASPFGVGAGANSRLGKLTTAVWVAQQGASIYSKIKDKYEDKHTWTVTVEEKDSSFLPVQRWLLETLPPSDKRSVIATTHTIYIDSEGVEDIAPSSKDRYPFDSYDGEKNGRTTESRILLTIKNIVQQPIMINGHKVKIQVSSNVEEGEGDKTRRSSNVRNGTIVFTCRSVEAQDAVVKHINSLIGGKDKHKPSLWVANGWGNWQVQDIPTRKIDSVVLKEGLKEELLADLNKFIKDEKKYTQLGIPYHRGYLFHGPAGTGKSSIIKALAGELGLDLWYAPLGDLKEDSSLVDLIRQVKSRGILLLEDVDSFSAAVDRADDGKAQHESGTGISTSALLNALDGVVTPHGLITVMTTNHLHKLDPALIRNGRADKVIELGLPSVEEMDRLWSLFFPDSEQWIVDIIGKSDPHHIPGISQAETSEIFKSNWDFAEKAREALIDKTNIMSKEVS